MLKCANAFVSIENCILLVFLRVDSILWIIFWGLGLKYRLRGTSKPSAVIFYIKNFHCVLPRCWRKLCSLKKMRNCRGGRFWSDFKFLDVKPEQHSNLNLQVINLELSGESLSALRQNCVSIASEFTIQFECTHVHMYVHSWDLCKCWYLFNTALDSTSKIISSVLKKSQDYSITWQMPFLSKLQLAYINSYKQHARGQLPFF
jgi:hypothetical protein